MTAAIALIALVALQRIAELPYAARNTKRLLAQGGVESGRGHYPLFVLLHAAWLIAIALALPKAPVIYWPFLLLYAVLEGLRLWVLWSLGPYWTTRIITVPGAPLVRRGPYRWLRHPNYWIVVGEIAVLPLVFGQIAVAVVFSLLNAGLLAWRIRIEERALGPRRAR
ncbi:MAG TPA: isoprenylcysteine carboxylmethyltransferase family protein [Rhizomicrobium sp.]|nr:isoprenylcysteine carboxylmethyltransferase family protein [Rhizomicrobium sp.]